MSITRGTHSTVTAELPQPQSARYSRHVRAQALVIEGNITHSVTPHLVFQLSYTTLFGSFASYLFLRTGSILPPITAHIFCNIMGLPQLGYEVSRFPKQKRCMFLRFSSRFVADFLSSHISSLHNGGPRLRYEACTVDEDAR